MNRGLSFLATTGSTATFIGLFGTVWGIKHSFEQIAISRTPAWPSWPPVSPRRCSRPAWGLVAAIPAAVFYNKLSADIDGWSGVMRPSPTNSRRSCRASWISKSWAWAYRDRRAAEGVAGAAGGRPR